MKYLGILATLAIIYLVVAQMGSTHGGVKSSVASADAEAAKVDPRTAAAPAAPGQNPNSLRRPIDRTREVNALVKQRNGAGEF